LRSEPARGRFPASAPRVSGDSGPCTCGQARQQHLARAAFRRRAEGRARIGEAERQGEVDRRFAMG
jgi:hypothetical protein